MSQTKILVAVDLQHNTTEQRVAEEAVKLAQTHQASVEVVFVIPDQKDGYAQHFVPDDMRAAVQAEAEKDLVTFENSVNWGDIPHSSKVLRGVVYEEIIARASATNSSFIVIGANRPNIKDLFIGPNAARVARHTNCSVLIVRP